MSAYQAVGRFVTVVLMVVIFLLALAPREVLPTVEGWNDKGEHILAFAVLAIGYAVFWAPERWRLIAGLTMYGVLIEIAQSLTPCRQASLLDVLADIAGIVLGLLVVAPLRRLFRWPVPGSPG